jgi:hypothetical protein
MNAVLQARLYLRPFVEEISCILGFYKDYEDCAIIQRACAALKTGGICRTLCVTCTRA